MPHLTLEFSSNLPGPPARDLLAALNRALCASGEFAGPDIKSRASVFDQFQIGEGGEDAAFAHMTLRLMPGRSVAQRQRLAQGLLQALAAVLPAQYALPVQLTVEIVELAAPCYAKIEIGASASP